MGLFRRLENRVEKSFEGGFGKAFKSNVQPVELARKLAREMDDSKTISVSRVYAPNIYTVYLSPRDREQFATYEASLRTELAGYLAEHARRQGYTVPGKLRVLLETAAELKVGTFGIAVLLSEDPVLPEEPAAPPTRGSRRVPRTPGQTGDGPAESAPASPSTPEPALPIAPAISAPAARAAVPPVPAVSIPMPQAPSAAASEGLPPEFSDDPSANAFPAAAHPDPSAPERPDAAAYDLEADDEVVQASGPIVDGEVFEPVVVAPPADLYEDLPVDEEPAARPTSSWLLSWPGGSYVVDRRAIVIGRSRDCDVVLNDGNVSRRHAELIRQSSMFLIRDLDSTNGVAVNGRRVREAAVAAGDVITIGATTITLERKR